MIYRIVSCLLFAIMLLANNSIGMQAAGWDDRFGPPGVDGGGWYPTVLISPPSLNDHTHVFASAVSGDYVYIGGAFTSAGGVAANYIARWHKSTGEWEALGEGVNDTVSAIAVVGDKVYVGGNFDKAGTVDAIHVAQWDATTKSWSGLGPGLGDSSVTGERVTNLVWQDELLYAGGSFIQAGTTTVNHIAAWNGSSWQPVGGGIEGDVRALAPAATGGVYVGGFFAQAGGVAANGVARWTGSAWQPLGTGVSGGDETVDAILEVAGSVYVAGDFTTAGGVAAQNLAQWNGSEWLAVGGGVNTIFGVDVLAWWNDSLVVGGTFQEAGNQPFRNVARWDGAAWHAFGKGTTGNVATLAVDGTQLYAGGFFRAAGDRVTNKVAHWDGSAWLPMGKGSQQGGPENFVTTIAPLDTSGDEVVIGGFFAEVGEEPDPFNPSGGDRFRSLARWDGQVWHPLGEFGLSSAFWSVSEVVAADDHVYIGGTFRKLDEDFAAQAIVRWNRQSNQWEPLGIGVGRPNEEAAISVEAIAVAPSGDVYAAGEFVYAGGEVVNNVARWDGTTWRPVGSGLTGGAQPRVEVLLLQGNILYAGGDFSQAGGAAVNGLAQWDGSAWSAVEPTFMGHIYALGVLGDDLIVGGSFTAQGLPNPTHLARWNGTSWSLLGGTDVSVSSHPEFTPAVYAIAVRGEEVFVGGNLVHIGAQIVNGVAHWTGHAWMPLGSGVAGGGPRFGSLVQDLALAGDSLYVGGNFTNAGGNPSSYFARHDLSGQVSDGTQLLPLVEP